MFYVDCAVSGGPKGATNATLTAFVGGEPTAIGRWVVVVVVVMVVGGGDGGGGW